MRMEPTESSETSAINITWTPETYPKDNKLQCSYYLIRIALYFKVNEQHKMAPVGCDMLQQSLCE